jgi:hypothetical protein
MGVGSWGDTDYSSSTWGNAVESQDSHGVRTRTCMVGVAVWYMRMGWRMDKWMGMGMGDGWA